MGKLIGKIFWLAVFLAVGYAVLFFADRPLADKVGAAVGIPAEWGQRLEAFKARLDGTASTLSSKTDGLTLSGVSQAITDLNSKVKPLVEQAVVSGQQILSGAAQVKDRIISTASGVQSAVQEKRQQINDAAAAVGQVVNDVQDLQNKLNAVTATPSAYASGAATGSVK